jgi:hypothetical protein
MSVLAKTSSNFPDLTRGSKLISQASIQVSSNEQSKLKFTCVTRLLQDWIC